MWEVRYFLDQAERCFRLARSVADPEATGKLEAMGAEFIGKAVERGVNVAPTAAGEGRSESS